MMFLVFFFLCAWICRLCNSRTLDPAGIFNGKTWTQVARSEESLSVLREKAPVKPSPLLWQSPNTLIFVGLTVYRDARCATTIEYLLTRAKYPDRVRIGVVQQRHTEDDHFHCINDYCQHQKNGARDCPHRSQLKMIEFTHQLARGPSYARSLAETLLTNEEFYLSLDAHSEVVENWDVLLLEEWGKAQNEYAILSTQPADISVLFDPSQLDSGLVPHVCQWDFDPRGWVVPAAPTQARNLEEPLLSTVYVPGFALMRTHAVKIVPTDPLLQLIYDGDAFTHYARLWTHGYDVYTPTRHILGHDYLSKMPVYGRGASGMTTEVEKMQWAHPRGDPDMPYFLYSRAEQRYRTLLGISSDAQSPRSKMTAKDLEPLTTYSLGHKRSLRQFAGFVGIDWWSHQWVHDRCLGPTSSPSPDAGNYQHFPSVDVAGVSFVPYYSDPDLAGLSSSSSSSASGSHEVHVDAGVELGDLWGHQPETQGMAQLVPLASPNTASLSFVPMSSYITLTSAAEIASSSGQKNAPDGRNSNINSNNNNNNNNNNHELPQASPLSNVEQTAESVMMRVIEYERRELWWIFAWLDAWIENGIDAIDQQVRQYAPGSSSSSSSSNSKLSHAHGRYVVRVVLVLLPFVVFILVLAMSLLMTRTGLHSTSAVHSFLLPRHHGSGGAAQQQKHR